MRSEEMAHVRISFRDGPQVTVEIRDEKTASVRALVDKLPFKSKAQTWGDEVYFSVPFHAPREQDSRMEMEVGEVAFWPDGDAIALFFGPTPISEGLAPMAFSPCNILGRVVGNPAVLKQVKPGTPLEVTRA
ncbi:MAG: hypothetical protein A3K76_02035 [Euryarchaeota archaeon RBG_13_57_23]|nr:MAG: hypothetical protein A3K76_02035 [Euryarchaeota archaeon RBG_13_57_23]